VNLATIIDPHPDDSVALISRGQVTTYETLRQQVAAVRGGLVELGLQPGDRLAILAGNNWYFVASYLAALGVGLIAVPLNPQAPAPELEYELATTGARAVLISPAAAAAFGALDRASIPDLEIVIVTAGVDLVGSILLDDLLACEAVPVVDRSADDLAVLMFTSGTVGAPRAAMLSHGNLLANLDQIRRSPGRHQDGDDVVFGLLPMFHIFGLNVMLDMSLLSGSTVLLIERFDPSSAVEAVERHEVTMMSGPPTMWSALASLGDVSSSFRSVRTAVSGAAKLSSDTVTAVRDNLGVALAEGYGLTETAPVITSATGTDAPTGSIGPVLPGIEMRLVDSDDEDALVGDSGEIWVRGPNVFTGYWHDPEATRAALTEDGWLRTGDVGVVDDDGFVYLIDRAKDLIIVSGFNVFPAEVEDVLIEHPAIDRAAVVGVPHPHTGEAVKAYVVLAPGHSAEEDDIITFCADRLARYKCPSKVMFVDDLPRSITGKVLRRALR